MTINQKRAILIISGLLLLGCTYFFIWQPNSDKILELERETSQYQSQINFLSALQMKVNQMKEEAPDYEKQTKAFTDMFPSKMTQPKAIYNVYKMMTSTGIRVTAISPGEEQVFLREGSVSGLGNTSDATDSSGSSGSSSDASASTGDSIQSDATEPNAEDVEKFPENEVPLNRMVGKVTPYQLTITGTLKQVNNTIDWIADNSEKMSVTDISLTYDSATGKLSGNLTVNYFALNGNGRTYVEPDIHDIMIGSKNIFGTVK